MYREDDVDNLGFDSEHDYGLDVFSLTDSSRVFDPEDGYTFDLDGDLLDDEDYDRI